jgi:hypothetical protein
LQNSRSHSIELSKEEADSDIEILLGEVKCTKTLSTDNFVTVGDEPVKHPNLISNEVQ